MVARGDKCSGDDAKQIFDPVWPIKILFALQWIN